MDDGSGWNARTVVGVRRRRARYGARADVHASCVQCIKILAFATYFAPELQSHFFIEGQRSHLAITIAFSAGLQYLHSSFHGWRLTTLFESTPVTTWRLSNLTRFDLQLTAGRKTKCLLLSRVSLPPQGVRWRV
jgi:hypothetical protein